MEERDKLLEDNIYLDNIVESLQTQCTTHHSRSGGYTSNLATGANGNGRCASCLELFSRLQEYKRLYGVLTYSPTQDSLVSSECNSAGSNLREDEGPNINVFPARYDSVLFGKCGPKMQGDEDTSPGNSSSKDPQPLSNSWCLHPPGSGLPQTSKFGQQASPTYEQMRLPSQARVPASINCARSIISKKYDSIQRNKHSHRISSVISFLPRRKAKQYWPFRPQSSRFRCKLLAGQPRPRMAKRSGRYGDTTSNMKSHTPKLTNKDDLPVTPAPSEAPNTLLPSPLVILQQRNNCLVQQLKVARAAKTALENKMKHLTTRLNGALTALCKSRDQEQRSRRVMQHLVEYINKLNKLVNLLDADLSNKTVEYFDEQVICYSPLLENNSVSYVYEISRTLAMRVQSSLEKKAQSVMVMRKKLTDFAQQDARRRALITELRRSLSEAKQEQSQLHSTINDKEKELQSTRQIEARLRTELESQRTQLKTLSREKVELTQELKNCQEANESVRERLNEVQRQLLDRKLILGTQVDNEALQSPQEPLGLSARNKLAEVLNLLQNMMNQLSVLAVNMLHGLYKEQSKRTEMNQLCAIESDSHRSVSPENLEIARQRAAQILGLSLRQLDRLTGKNMRELLRSTPNFRHLESARLMEKALNWPAECRKVIRDNRLLNVPLDIFNQIMDDFQLIAQLCTLQH
ncbi:unnamed protein product [Dicrocoelium dendriticum]|nr:unnamed protein product [Dicrocoelium dendriticum]